MRWFLNCTHLQIEVTDDHDADLDWLDLVDPAAAREFFTPLAHDAMFLADLRRVLGEQQPWSAPSAEDDQQVLERFAGRVARGELRVLSARRPTLRPLPVMEYMEVQEEESAPTPALSDYKPEPIKGPAEEPLESLLANSAGVLAEASHSGNALCDT